MDPPSIFCSVAHALRHDPNVDLSFAVIYPFHKLFHLAFHQLPHRLAFFPLISVVLSHSLYVQAVGCSAAQQSRLTQSSQYEPGTCQALCSDPSFQVHSQCTHKLAQHKDT